MQHTTHSNSEDLARLLFVGSDLKFGQVLDAAFAASWGQYELRSASNADAAMKVLQDGEFFYSSGIPDLIMVDLDIGIENCFDLISSLRSAKQTRALPIVIVATTTIPPVEEALYRAGANLFIEKTSFRERSTEVVQIVTEYWFQSF